MKRKRGPKILLSTRLVTKNVQVLPVEDKEQWYQVVEYPGYFISSRMRFGKLIESGKFLKIQELATYMGKKGLIARFYENGKRDQRLLYFMVKDALESESAYEPPEPWWKRKLGSAKAKPVLKPEEPKPEPPKPTADQLRRQLEEISKSNSPEFIKKDQVRRVFDQLATLEGDGGNIQPI